MGIVRAQEKPILGASGSPRGPLPASRPVFLEERGSWSEKVVWLASGRTREDPKSWGVPDYFLETGVGKGTQPS